jgi:hypothetical protein
MVHLWPNGLPLAGHDFSPQFLWPTNQFSLAANSSNS